MNIGYNILSFSFSSFVSENISFNIIIWIRIRNVNFLPNLGPDPANNIFGSKFEYGFTAPVNIYFNLLAHCLLICS
jgi:hypothetical protein